MEDRIETFLPLGKTIYLRCYEIVFIMICILCVIFFKDKFSRFHLILINLVVLISLLKIIHNFLKLLFKKPTFVSTRNELKFNTFLFRGKVPIKEVKKISIHYMPVNWDRYSAFDYFVLKKQYGNVYYFESVSKTFKLFAYEIDLSCEEFNKKILKHSNLRMKTDTSFVNIKERNEHLVPKNRIIGNILWPIFTFLLPFLMVIIFLILLF